MSAKPTNASWNIITSSHECDTNEHPPKSSFGANEIESTTSHGDNQMNHLAIELRGVTKQYPYFTLDNIDLELPRGEVMGFIGPNGAGKSTTIRILMGLVHQDAGHVSVLGHEMPARQVIAKRAIGFASEDMRLYKRATLAWHIDFVRSIYPSWDPAYARQLLRRFDLNTEQKIKGLSRGQQVKAGLLLALARRPSLLILDEPTTGLDPVARHEVLSELMEVLADDERTILFSSHNTLDVEQISDRISFIDRGRIIASQDKESYLDRWRRIRLQLPTGADLPTLPQTVAVEGGGRIVAVTTDQFDDDILVAYKQAGATVQGVEPLTLEEIFVANVAAHRERRAA